MPFSQYDRVVLAHGGGGRATRSLVESLFRAALDSPELREDHDGAIVSLEGPVAITTDGFTVRPLFFPGGDLGALAVHGTVNDLACCGARPELLTVSFVLEEGLALTTLARLVRSMGEAARAVGARVIAGDTKVVERGKGDGVYVSVTGLGRVRRALSPRNVRDGDVVIVSGPVGDHGIAVLVAREDVRLGTEIASDQGEIASLVHELLDEGVALHVARDPTRGGLATVLVEIARTAGVSIVLEEPSVPVRSAVSDACELLGLDPLYVACEGRVVLFVAPEHAERALAIARRFQPDAARIGVVTEGPSGLVLAKNAFGGERVLELLSGEQLPRIC
ncbi:MAG: hydrogenase expression/formation protein HypE [Sandaracinaceae bacterium]|nr:hydrogenase expression/formation protein HypE [Sandaracinaceae bacterium]